MPGPDVNQAKPQRRRFLHSAIAVLALFSGVAAAEDGAALFAERCAPCHQPQGQGLDGRYPPLTHLEDWLATAEGRHYIARVVMHGFAGPITVGDQHYKGLMLTYRWRLKDPQIMAVLNYVAETLNAPQEGYVPFDLQLLGDIRAHKLPDAEVATLREQLPLR
jgi:mono/diheme cytochrome c family protein